VHYYLTNLLSTSGWNSSGYGSETTDAAIMKFAQATDFDTRKAAYDELITLLQDEMPMIPIDNQLQQYWVRANVYGMEPLPTMEIRMEPVYIAE
jgi:ABC-type transport system substrate-binding protein